MWTGRDGMDIVDEDVSPEEITLRNEAILSPLLLRQA